jgi:molybdenum cofactor cytidylyltransferase
LNHKPNIATLVLAAGNSSRMGDIKQLLAWKDTFLLNHVINTSLQLDSLQTIVVLGGNYERIKGEIQQEHIQIIYNENWENGLGSSIAFGVNYIMSNYHVDGILITLADQPLINNQYLKTIIDSFKIDKKQIVASKYGRDKLGVPALFDSFYFKELSEMNQDKGAKKVIENHLDNVLALSANHLISDIDTKEDYKRLYDENH